MKKEETHISSYSSHAIVLIVLLVLTTISVLVTKWHLGAFTVAVALIIASIKVGTVIIHFMHVKFESLFYKTDDCRSICSLCSGYYYNFY